MATPVYHDVGPGKTYTTLNAWDAGVGIRRNLVTADEIEVVRVYGGASVLSTSLTISTGWTTDATRYIEIQAAAGEEHQGVWDTNKAHASLSGISLISCGKHVRATKMQFSGFNATVLSNFSVIDACIIKIAGTNGTNYPNNGAYYHSSVSLPSVIKNSIILGSGSSSLLMIWYNSGSGTVYNCTIINDSYGYCFYIIGTCVSQNNYIKTPTSGYGYGGATAGANDITSNSEAITSTLRNIPYFDSTSKVWQETGTNAFPIATSYPSSVVYDGKMWMIGGAASGAVRKVYWSTNGTTWTEAGTNALPVGLYTHSSVVFDGKMWVIGGYTGSAAVRTVYWSTNGSSWTEAGTNSLPVAKNNHQSVVYDGMMWVIGGGGGTQKEVYSSTDGINWTEVGALPVVSPTFSALVFDDGTGSKMWAVAVGYSSCYYSADGIAWTLAGSLPLVKYYQSACVFDSKMWLMGGGADDKSVLTSTNGKNWYLTQPTTNTLPAKMEYGTALSYNSKMWAIGNNRKVLSYPYSTTTYAFQNITSGSENLRPVVSATNKLLDNGANLTSSGVTTDIIGTVRPQFGGFDIGAFENDIPICWNYTARYKNSNKLFKASGCGAFPKSLRVPSNVDTSTGKMVDDGIFINPDKYTII